MLNQVAVWVDTDDDWDIFDLRNIVSNIVQNHLGMLGFLLGRAYDFSVTRVLSQSRNVDYVFGIDVPGISDDAETMDVQQALNELSAKAIGTNGIYLNRCFGDLVAAIKHADDTAFYCYRAIESLRHHFAATHELASESKVVQWSKFREAAGCEHAAIMAIKTASDGLRHGDPTSVVGHDRAELLRDTWGIVRSYINQL
ncbi:hypothetical protein [Ralstonia pseudosolanacearum]|uniref:hypothetical protein n=1 Tax=Ralstonia pseudosolanacearum TaxID=1310165 RepID=UPI002E22D240